MSKSVEVRNMFLHPHFFTKKKGGSLMTIWKLLKKTTDMSSPPCKLIVLMSEKDEICYYLQHHDLYIYANFSFRIFHKNFGFPKRYLRHIRLGSRHRR